AHSLDQLADYAGRRARTGRRLKIGGDSQFFERPEWRRVKDAYGLDDGPGGNVATVAMDPSLMYGAVKDGQVDVIVAYTSDGRIPLYDLDLLSDPKEALPPYDAVLLLSPEAARRPGLRAALEPLVGAVSVEAMRRANQRVDVDRWPARRAAEELYAGLRQ